MRKTKLTRPSELPTYHGFSRFTFKGQKGYLYKLSETLTDAEKQALTDRHNNILFMSVRSEYAPELRTQAAIFVADKVIKN